VEGAERRCVEDLKELEGVVFDTAEKLAGGDEVKGGVTLAEFVEKLPKKISKIWRWDSSSPSLSLRGCEGDEESAGTGARLLWVGEMGEPEERGYIVGDLIPKNHATTIHGGGGSAKSMLAADLAVRYTNKGGMWLGYPMHGQGRALFVDFELDAAEFNRRVKAVAAGAHISGPLKNLAYFEVGDMPTPQAFKAVRALCNEHDFDLVIIDSVGPALEGDVGQAKDVLAFHRKYISPLRKDGRTPVLIDHQGRSYSEGEYQGKGAYGNSYKEHLSRSVIQADPQPKDEDSNELVVRVRQKKANFGAQRRPFDAVVTFGEGVVIIERRDVEDEELVAERTVSIEKRIKSALADANLDKYEIAARLGSDVGYIANKLSKLKRFGEVEEVGKEGRTPIYGLCGDSSSPSHPLGVGEGDEESSDGDSQPRIAKDFG